MRLLKDSSERGAFIDTPPSFSHLSFGLLVATSIIAVGVLFHILINIVWSQGPVWIL